MLSRAFTIALLVGAAFGQSQWGLQDQGLGLQQTGQWGSSLGSQGALMGGYQTGMLQDEGSAKPLWSMQFSSAAMGESVPLASPAAAAVKGPKPIAKFHNINQPIMADSNTLPVIEMPAITQTYTVPSTVISQENIKQPITQPVLQPYLQRYVQQAQPIVQPIVNRVLQPVIHRQLKPFLTSEVVQGPAQPAITNAAQYRSFTNAPIVGAPLTAAPMVSNVQAPPLPQVAASVSKA